MAGRLLRMECLLWGFRVRWPHYNGRIAFVDGDRSGWGNFNGRNVKGGGLIRKCGPLVSGSRVRLERGVDRNPHSRRMPLRQFARRARTGGACTAPIRLMCVAPQSQIAFRARLRDRPYSVSEYSTLGGTVG